MNASQVKHVRRRLCIVLTLFLSCFLGLFYQHSYAQRIDSIGRFRPANTGKPYAKGSKVSPPGNFLNASPADIKAYKTALLLRVNSAIYNLEDDSLDLKGQYKVLWGQGFADNLKAELKGLKAFLETDAIDRKPAYKYVPHPDSIAAFANRQIYSIAKKVIAKADYEEHQVFRKDLLKAYLLNRYNAQFAAAPSLKSWVMDMSYVKSWREVEYWAESVKRIKASAEIIRKDVFKADQKEIAALEDELSKLNFSNGLTQWIQNSNFIKSWLWYTAAQPAVNPLLVTSPDRKYPDKEKYTFLTAEKRAVQAELEKKDLLNQFKHTERVFNKIMLPVIQDDKKVKLHEFDISQDTVAVKFPNETLDEGEKLKVAIYNIPTLKELTLTQGTVPLKYPGRILSELDSIAEIVGELATFGKTNIAKISALTGRLNPEAMNPIQYKFGRLEPKPDLSKEPNWQEALYVAQRESSGIDSLRSGIKLNIFSPKALPDPATFALINTKYVPLSKDDLAEDKRRILYTTKAYTKKGDFQLIKRADKELIENFILTDVGFLDYRDNATFKNDVDSMVDRFVGYEKEIKRQIVQLDKVIAETITKYDKVVPYLRFINRSLPPEPLDAELDKDPVYLTKIEDVTVPEAPKKINLSISLTDPKTKETEDLAKETVKVIRTQRLDVSAGIGYTFNPYDISSQSGTALPTSKTGDAIQFVAGLHIYFWKPLNRLHVNPFKHADEKISLYLGLTLKNALDHYFAGLSYDVVPGIRLIGGLHFYNNPRFEIVNDAVAKKASGLTNAGGFMSLNMQAATLGKLIGLF